MFMDLFDGPVSGPLNDLALGSAGGSAAGAQALGSSEQNSGIIGAVGLMPGWIVAALAHNLGL
ncbi:MAG TPA: hypothetical protein K8V11_04355 [Dietzia timorensis]|uniref:Uncharacterized protein n=1 Tax=Dietzia timorensis TaxID=499555 RepID=A0A921F2I9_9ACTN|nr:hypothetical protein [Dietzia timorensis]HJE90220.1 hypothetical protein [Dietzia timorensis]